MRGELDEGLELGAWRPASAGASRERAVREVVEQPHLLLEEEAAGDGANFVQRGERSRAVWRSRVFCQRPADVQANSPQRLNAFVWAAARVVATV